MIFKAKNPDNTGNMKELKIKIKKNQNFLKNACILIELVL